MLLSFTVVLVFFILILSIILYNVFENISVKSLKQTNAQILSQVSYSANYMHENARNFSFSIFNDRNTTLFMYSDKIDDLAALDESARLKDLVQMNSFVQSVYLYNRKMDRFIYSSAPFVETGEAFYDQQITGLMKDYRKNKNGLAPIPRSIKVILDGREQFIDVYTYILVDLFTVSGEVEGAVIVNIRSEYLKNMVETLNVESSINSGNMLIVNEKGISLSASDNNLYLSNLSSRSYVQKVLSDPSPSGHFTDVVEGGRVLVTYVSSQGLGWKFINVIPYDTISSQIDPIKSITFTVCFVLLILGLCISIYISRRIYSPIQNLVGKITHLMNPSPLAELKEMDDVSLLSYAFTKTYDKAKLLDAAERDIMLIQRDTMLRNLLLNVQPEIEKITSAFHKFSVSLNPDDSYALISLRIDHFGDFSRKYTQRDQELLRYAITNVIQEVIVQEYVNEAVVVEDDLFIVVLNVAGETYDELHRKLYDLIEDIQEWVSKHLQITLSGAFGYVSNNLLEINRSYQEVVNLSKYRLIYGSGSILSPDSLKDQIHDPVKIPGGKEKKLLDALTDGKLEEAIGQYKEIIVELKQYSFDIMMSTILYLTYSVYNTLNVMEGNSLNRFHVDFNTFMRNITHAETIEQIDGFFLELFQHITEVIQQRKNSRFVVITDTVVKLIESNYTDKGLCLESIAISIKMSKVYVGKLFRDTYGQSVADFITDFRLNKAMEMLKEGRHNLSSILDRVGMENKTYFYKLFKTKMGVSFTDYKLKYMNEMAQNIDEK